MVVDKGDEVERDRKRDRKDGRIGEEGSCVSDPAGSLRCH